MARLYEYQGKELLKQFKVPIPRGGVARTPEQARQMIIDGQLSMGHARAILGLPTDRLRLSMATKTVHKNFEVSISICLLL